MNPRSQCIILVPIWTQPELSTDILLNELKDRGYTVRRLYGGMYIDKVRSAMATKAVKEGYDEIMWIDSDMTFDPDYVDVLRSHELPIVCGLYCKKSSEGGIAAVFLKECKKATFGRSGGLIEIRYAATGFLYTRRDVYKAIEERFDLPLCEDKDYGDIYPYFYPMILHDGEKYNYMGEDTSFCERAIHCGYRIYADTTLRLGHIGKYRYSWEDFAGDRPRAKTVELEID